jgi:hypothetical protein
VQKYNEYLHVPPVVCKILAYPVPRCHFSHHTTYILEYEYPKLGQYVSYIPPTSGRLVYYSRHYAELFLLLFADPRLLSVRTERRFGPLQQAPHESGTSCLSRVDMKKHKELTHPSPKA